MNYEYSCTLKQSSQLKAPSTRIFLNLQLLFADSASVDTWSGIQIRTFFNVLSRVEIFEYVMNPAGIMWTLNPGGGGVLPYMGYIGMCRCEGYGSQVVYSRIGYTNQSVWV